MNALIEATLERLVEAIEGEQLDWRKTWAGGGLPMNHTTGRRYHGVNILLLWSAAQERSFPTQHWASYKQWAAAGYQVGKGQKSTTIFISKDVEKTDKATGDVSHYRLLRCAFVFNAAQLVDPPELVEGKPLSLTERHVLCERTIVDTGANIFETETPLYRPAIDMIGMPKAELFASADCYYATLFHELVHWTGAKQRCDRTEDKVYAFEELVAEFGAAFLCAAHGITEFPDHDNHAAYLQSWLTKFKDDKPGALLRAAGLAAKAVEFIEACAIEEKEAAA